MQVLRTPEERFDGLADFPYQARYAEVAVPDGGTLRIAYLAEGPSDGQWWSCCTASRPGPTCTAR